MRGLMLILSVAVVVMTADASSLGSDKSWAERIESKIRLAELYEEIEALEGKDEGYRALLPHFTEHQKRLCNLFTRLDLDKSGSITQSDYTAIMAILNVVEGRNDKQKSFANGMVALGYKYFFENISGSVEVFRANIDEMIANKTIWFWFNNVFAVYFIAVDANEDGLMCFDEYKPVYNTLFPDGVILDDATKAFSAADTDNSGCLTLCEYSNYAASYFLSEKNDGSQYFFGPILGCVK